MRVNNSITASASCGSCVSGERRNIALFEDRVLKRVVGIAATLRGTGKIDGGTVCGSLRIRDWKYSSRDAGGGLPVYV